MIRQDVATLARSIYNNFNNHNTDAEWLDRLLSVIGDGCMIVDMPSGTTLRGRDGARERALQWHKAFPDGKIEITNLFCTEDQAVVEYTGRGTQTGPLSYPRQGEVPPTGKKVELRFCDVLRVENGKVSRQASYYDALSMMYQLGFSPAAKP